MPLIGKNASKWGFAAKVEPSYAGATTLDPATDGKRLVKPAGVKVDYAYDGKRTGKSPGTYARVPRVGAEGRFGELDWSSEAAGAGEAYSATKLPLPHLALLACGMKAVIDTTADAETVTYTPGDDADFASIACESYEDGQKFAVQGILGDSFEIAAELAHIAMFDGKLKGIMAAATSDAAIPGTFAYNGTVGPKATQMALSFGTGTPFAPVRVSKFSLKGKTGLTDRYYDNANGRHGGFFFGEQRELTLEVDIEAPALKAVTPYYDATSLNAWLLHELGDSFAVSLVVGAAQYKKFTISAGQAQMAAPARDKKGAVATIKLAMDLMPSSEVANDEVSILYN